MDKKKDAKSSHDSSLVCLRKVKTQAPKLTAKLLTFLPIFLSF